MSLFKNETTLPILITIACTLLMAGMLLYGYNTGKFTWLDNNTQKQNLVQTAKEEEKIKRTDYTEVARKTLDWIDKEKNIMAGIIWELDCKANGCQMRDKDDLITTWTRLIFYEQNKDSKDLEIVKKEINKFWEEYRDEDLSDSLWLCKVTYEMAQSKDIDQEQKDKLKKLCFNTKEVTVEEKEKYGKENFKNETMTTLPLMTIEENVIYSRYMDNYFGQVSDLAYKYAWSGEDKYKELIEKYFLLEEKLILSGEVRKPQNLCLFGLSAFDTWKLVDKSKTRLDYVIDYYKIIESKNENENFLANPICGLLIEELFKATGDNVYLKKLNIINEKIVNNNKDEKGTIGDGFGRLDLSNSEYNPNRNVIESGLVIQCLF